MAAWDKDLDPPGQPAWAKDLDDDKPKSVKAPKPELQQRMQNLAGSIVGGAAGLGSALVELGRSGGSQGEPFSTIGERVKKRMGSVENVLGDTGVETDSGTYGTGKFFTQVAGTAGVGPLFAAGAKALPFVMPRVVNALNSGGFTTGGTATGFLGRTGDVALRGGAGAAVGAGSAALTDPGSIDMGAGVGAGMAMVLPPVARFGADAINYAGNKLVRPVADLFTGAGPMNIARKYVNSIVGDGNMPAVLARTANAPQIVPGSKPTVSEAVAGLPEGSPLNALQAITAKTYGGPSADFGKRLADQEAALEAAKVSRKAATDPMRDAAIAAANVGGVKSGPVVAQMDAMAAVPGDRASDIVTKTLGAVRTKIEALTDANTGNIHAADLYTVRKEVGNTIHQFAKDTANWDKKRAASLEREVQKHIDDAIEAGGGTGWKAYLKEYSDRSQAIASDVARRELAGAQLQPTNLAGGLNIAEQTRPHTPNLLSRPAMALNFLLRAAGKNVEPKVDEALARIMLDPSTFTAEMSKLPPKTRVEVERLLRKGNLLQSGVSNALAPSN